MSDSAGKSDFLGRLWGALRLRGGAAGDLTAQTLHSLMLMLLLLLGIHVGLAEIINPNKVLITLLGIPMILTPVTTLILLRKNRVHTAGVVYLAGMWISFTAIIVLNGGIRHVGLAVYIALAVSAAWLFGYRAALWTAAACIGVTLLMAILETERLGPPRLLPGTPFGAWMLVVESTLMGVVPVVLVLSSLREALARSQQAESELKAHEQQLEQIVQQRTAELVEARDQAQNANKAKSVFLANMSHELRTPLNAILGFSTIVRDDPALARKHRKDLDIVNHSGEHLLNLIDDVLDVAKIEAGRVVLDKATFDLPDFLRMTVELIRPRAQQKGLELLFKQTPLVPRFVAADPGKLRQVLINLIGNAVKYTAQGSIVVTADARKSADRVTLMLEVADTGIGIAPEDQTRIFDPFVQASTGSSHKGTGLGLAISRSFVELMGGTVGVQSTPGIGSAFRIEVPVLEQEDSAIAAADRLPRRVVALLPGQPDYRVLIVEDQIENWMLLQRMLETAGFQVRVAESGEQAIKLFESWRPRFVWMDVGLPHMNGVETTRRIRSLEGGLDAKIVAVTASAFDTERQAVLAAGLDGFLRKPYRAEEIFDCMAALLGIQYAYGDDALEAGPSVSLHPDSVSAIPLAVRDELASAVLRLEPGGITAAVRHLSEFNPAVGRAFAAYAEEYAYSKILAALELSGKRAAQADAG